eukprot:Clim_evm12s40 gene=Clim_evmTU12s40
MAAPRQTMSYPRLLYRFGQLGLILGVGLTGWGALGGWKNEYTDEEWLNNWYTVPRPGNLREKSVDLAHGTVGYDAAETAGLSRRQMAAAMASLYPVDYELRDLALLMKGLQKNKVPIRHDLHTLLRSQCHAFSFRDLRECSEQALDDWKAARLGMRTAAFPQGTMPKPSFSVEAEREKLMKEKAADHAANARANKGKGLVKKKEPKTIDPDDQIDFEAIADLQRRLVDCLAKYRWHRYVENSSIAQKASLWEPEDWLGFDQVSTPVRNGILARLSSRGAAIVYNAFTKEQLAPFQELVKYSDFKSTETPSGKLGPDINTVETSRGRLHLNAFQSPQVSEAMKSLIKPFLPIVHGFLYGQDVYLSDMQVLVNQPGSEDQRFHVNNCTKGITVIVPLVEVTEAGGPTEILPGSQMLLTRGLQRTIGPLMMTSYGDFFCELLGRLRPKYRPKLQVGDMFVFDSRTIHRGLSNLSSNGTPILVFRFDPIQYPSSGRQDVLTGTGTPPFPPSIPRKD